MKKKPNQIPKQYSLVKYVPYSGEEQNPFGNQHLLFLGEIPNMPGHCAVAEVKSGKVQVGYHTSRFVEIPEDQT